jgi:hypothetical protein
MSHEARINDALKTLGEEFRLGMVQPEEYRARRRLLLESWNELEVTTSPGSLRSLPPHTPPAAKRVAAPALDERNTPRMVLIGLTVAVAFAASAWLTFGPKKTPLTSVAQPAPAVPAQAPPNAQVLAARKAAEDFLTLNAWEQGPVDAMLAQWRQLSQEDRARAREEPAIRTLRFKLDQNIQAESQLVAPDASPEDRARLDLLTRFAEELDG